MKIIKATIIALLILVLGVNGLDIFDKECKNDGSLKLVVKADSKNVLYTKDIEVRLGNTAMQGSWDRIDIVKSTTAARGYSTFQSEENILTAKRPYPINLIYKMTNEDGSEGYETKSFEVECPGLEFSCKNLNITIQSCENQEGGFFRAVLFIGGLEQSERAKMDINQVVDFMLETENKYKDTTGKETTRGTLPYKSQVIRMQKDMHVVRYEFSSKNMNTVKNIWAGYNNNMRYQCKQDKYPSVKFYDKIDCTIPQVTQEEQKEEYEVEIETEAVRQTPQQNEENQKTAEQILQEKPKNYKPLAIVSIILILVLAVGGIILSYLYKRGYL